MCLIVDNDVVQRVLMETDDRDYDALHDCLFAGKSPRVRLVHGGQLGREYRRSHQVARLVRALDQAGRARAVSDDAVDAECAQVAACGHCESNDHHVIALARVAGVRLLCSEDQALHRDFTNKQHRQLLVAACGDL